MMRIIDRSGRERLEPDGYILQDGESYRVPMKFMDSAQREALDMLRTATYPRFAPTNPRNLTDAQMKRYNDAYNTYLTNLTTAWQKGRDPLPPSNQQQQPPSRSDPTMDAREAAYREYCDRISNAWRT